MWLIPVGLAFVVVYLALKSEPAPTGSSTGTPTSDLTAANAQTLGPNQMITSGTAIDHFSPNSGINVNTVARGALRTLTTYVNNKVINNPTQTRFPTMTPNSGVLNPLSGEMARSKDLATNAIQPSAVTGRANSRGFKF